MGNRIGFWNWKIAAGVSFGIHLLFILIVSILFSGTEVDRSRIHYVKVALRPIEEEKSTSGVIYPDSMKDRVERPKKKEPVQEQRQKEPAVKREIELPIPLPVQTLSREMPAEEPEPSSSPPPGKEEKVPEPVPLTRVAALVTDLILKKEDPQSLPATLSSPGGDQGNTIPDSLLAEKRPGTGQGGLRGEPPGNGPETGKDGLSWQGIGEGPQMGRKSFYGEGSGKGVGSGTGGGSGQEDSPGEGARKGGGFFAKLFSSSGGTGVGSPRYAENPKPPYPKEARDRGHQGEVLLRVEVLASGRVGKIEVKRSSGYELLDQSALSTVKQWKFIPAKRGEDPIPLWVNIPIKFKLQ